MLTRCATGTLASASTMASTMRRLSASMRVVLTGASADTATTLSVGRSRPASFSAAPGCSRSTSPRLSASVGMRSLANRATSAPPTKPLAPITTTRLGAWGVALPCSSIPCLASVRCRGASEAYDIRGRPGARRGRRGRHKGSSTIRPRMAWAMAAGRHGLVLRPGREDHQRIGAGDGLQRLGGAGRATRALPRLRGRRGRAAPAARAGSCRSVASDGEFFTESVFSL